MDAKTLQIRVKSEVLERIKEASVRKGTSVSHYVREAVLARMDSESEVQKLKKELDELRSMLIKGLK